MESSFFPLVYCCDSSPFLMRNVPYFWFVWMQFPGVCFWCAIFQHVELPRSLCFAAPHLWNCLTSAPQGILGECKNGCPSIFPIVWKPKVARLEPWEAKCNDWSFVTYLFVWMTSSALPVPTRSDQESGWSFQMKSRDLLFKMCKYVLVSIWALLLFKDDHKPYQ